MLLVLGLVLLSLSACTTPTVAYFPVRHDSGISLLLPNYGKIVLEDGLLRFKENFSDTSYLLIWPHGFSYRVSGSRVEVLDAEGTVVAKTGQYKLIGGGPASSVEYYTGEQPPVPVPGPYWAMDRTLKNLYPWDYGSVRELAVLLLLVLAVVTIIVWFTMRRRRKI
ncbi:hypothetical protein JP09_009265 [Dehalogenimonas etheniformans]|uniref:Uncharacterized protein n=2 Tax=Dehalogenimonas etheniformans TaxID=1536648 RepID=A0A2P5P5D6_9CHLR|nr:hypothetical protein JP09_009265 [Dehalogenimonas etheniformans]